MPQVDPGLEAFANGLLEFGKHLPAGQQHPIEIVVLRGHLLIERELVGLVEAKLKEPTAIDLTRLPFNIVSRFAEALYGKSVPAWLWEETKQLNVIRNSLAHRLHDETVETRIQHFIAEFKKRDAKTFQYVPKSTHEELAYCLAHLQSELLKLRHL